MPAPHVKMPHLFICHAHVYYRYICARSVYIGTCHPLRIQRTETAFEHPLMRTGLQMVQLTLFNAETVVSYAATMI